MKFYLSFLLLSFSVSAYSQRNLRDVGPEYKKLKFGVLVDNKDSLIYRSEKLGESGLEKLSSYLYQENLPFPKTIIYLNKTGYRFPFTFALDEYFLQEDYGYKFIHSYGENRTYLNGHDPYFSKEEIDKKRYISRRVRSDFPY